jgi:hypothetical protein
MVRVGLTGSKNSIGLLIRCSLDPKECHIFDDLLVGDETTEANMIDYHADLILPIFYKEQLGWWMRSFTKGFTFP